MGPSTEDAISVAAFSFRLREVGRIRVLTIRCSLLALRTSGLFADFTTTMMT